MARVIFGTCVEVPLLAQDAVDQMEKRHRGPAHVPDCIQMAIFPKDEVLLQDLVDYMRWRFHPRRVPLLQASNGTTQRLLISVGGYNTELKFTLQLGA